MSTELDFKALLADIEQNPERINDPSLSDDVICAIQKAINPYSYVAGDAGTDEKKRSVAASFTNLRADYLTRFAVTGVVGFTFRVLAEWAPEAADRQWVDAAAAAKEAKARGAKPPSAADLADRAAAIAEVAGLARDAALEATAAEAAAAEADRAFNEASLVGTATLEALAGLRDTAESALRSADASRARACGLQYAAIDAMRTAGLECDACIDGMAAIARQYPNVREVIDQSPVVRAPAGQREIPADVAVGLVRKFLRTWFEYDPDAHVRSAHDEFVCSRSHVPVAVAGLDGDVLVDAADPTRFPLGALRGPAPAAATELDAEVVAAIRADSATYNAVVALLRSPGAIGPAQLALADPDRYRHYLAAIPADSPARPAIDHIPPQDTFTRLGFYMDANMEALRAATEAIYHDKPDLDWALIIYEMFEGSDADIKKAAETFRDRYQDELISDIKCVDLGNWTLLADFAKNRDNTNIYNKHTEILKRILDRHGEDKKMGQELMRNRVRQAKAKNIREAGPDAPGLADYCAGASNLGSMGAQRVLSQEEKLRLERAGGNLRAAKELEVHDQCTQTIQDLTATAKVRALTSDEQRRLDHAKVDIVRAQEMLEVPDDAIQVDVWSNDPGGKGFTKSKFYTKAEAIASGAPAEQ